MTRKQRLIFGSKVIGRFGSYQKFLIPKRRGGMRLIAMPEPKLMELQRSLLRSVERIAISPFTFGITRGTREAAKSHFSSSVLFRVDIEDFFTNVTLSKLQADGVHRRMARYANWSPIDILGIVCLPVAPFNLPQGAPTSPLIADLYLISMDYGIARDLCRFAASNKIDPRDIAYTRYIDDLNISISREVPTTPLHEKIILEIVRRRISQKSLSVAESKTGVHRFGDFQMSLGYSLAGERLQVSRALRDRARKAMWTFAHGEEMTEQQKATLNYARTGHLRLPGVLMASTLGSKSSILKRAKEHSVAAILSRGLFARWSAYRHGRTRQDILDATMAILCSTARLVTQESLSMLLEVHGNRKILLNEEEAYALQCLQCGVFFPRKCQKHER